MWSRPEQPEHTLTKPRIVFEELRRTRSKVIRRPYLVVQEVCALYTQGLIAYRLDEVAKI
jgi:hypothetical protein